MTEPLTTVFVDGANWSKQLAEGFRINYNKLVRALQRETKTRIISLYYYTGFTSQECLGRRMPFLEYLKNLGWVVQAMPATLGVDGRWRDKEVDISIALDAYAEICSGAAQALILGSGDEDFGALYRRLPEGTQAWAVGWRGHMSARLPVKAIFLDDLDVVERSGAKAEKGA